MDEKKEKKFISERVLGREMTLRRALKWILVSLACGIVFGAAVFGVFYIGRKAVNRAEQKQQEAISESVSEEETEPEALQATETEPETKEKKQQKTTEEPSKNPEMGESGETEKTSGENGETVPEETEEGSEGEQEGETEESRLDPEKLHESLLEVREKYPYTSEDLDLVLGTQAEACKNISRYIVRVSNTISEMTWFESTVETRRDYSGILLSVEETEVLVLTVSDAITEEGSLSVTFHDGTGNPAVAKQVSKRDGLAVVAVSTEGLGEDFLEQLQAAEIVPTQEITAGMPVISAGSPIGAVNSFGFGSINYVAEPESVEDGQQVCCYTQAPSVPERGTFLMTVDGRLLGLAVQADGENEITGNRFLAADSCRTLLGSLKKGNDMAWLGITGIDISFEMKYKNIPEGMYVTNVNEAGPAYAAGLKRGDIIVKIGAREIRGLSDYLSFLRSLHPGETVTVTVQRETIRSEYKEMELEMTAGTR